MPMLRDSDRATFDFDLWGKVASVHLTGDVFVVEADSIEQALEVLYREANIGETGPWVESYRVRDRARSLSVGDFVLAPTAAYQVMPVGFVKLDPEQREELYRLTSPRSRSWLDAYREAARL